MKITLNKDDYNLGNFIPIKDFLSLDKEGNFLITIKDDQYKNTIKSIIIKCLVNKIKQECGKRIESRYPSYKQRNIQLIEYQVVSFLFIGI